VDDPLTQEAPLVRARRYRKVAVQYSEFAGACISPFLRGFYRRIAEDYLARAEVALRDAEREATSPEREGLSKRDRGAATPRPFSPGRFLRGDGHMDMRPS
jgi:hypothetical protein